MAGKKFKTNSRGDAQLALWLPESVVRGIYDGFEKAVAQAQKAGEMTPKFKEYFYNKFIRPNK